MKYYKIDIKWLYDKPMQYVAKGDTFKTTKKELQMGRANGKLVPNGKHYFDRMGEGEIIKDAPVFDSFFLESFDKKIYWEWRLQDVHKFIGVGSIITGWYISTRFKELLEQFNIAKDYYFYPTKLLYKGEKLDYWIFQYAGSYGVLNKSHYIDFEKSIFIIENSTNEIIMNNYDEYILNRTKISNEYDKDVVFKRLVLKEAIDFIHLSPMSSDRLISEKLKQAIETAGLEGFEFSEVDYEIGIG